MKLYLGGTLDLTDLTLSGEVDMTTNSVRVLRGRRPGLGSSRLDAAEIAGLHGTPLGRAWYEALEFSVRLSVSGTSHQDAEDNVGEVKRILARDRNGPRSVRLGWTAEQDRFRMAQHRGISSIEEVGYTRRMDVDFVAGDPRAWGTTREVQTETLDADPYTFDISDVGGTADTEPVWTWTVGAAGVGSGGVSLENTTTGVKVEISGALVEADQLRIDAGRRHVVELSEDGGSTWTAIMDRVTATQGLPGLRGGQTNAIELTGAADGSLEVVWRARYW